MLSRPVPEWRCPASFSNSGGQVFRTPFQSAPLDLGTDAFFPAREALIMSRLKEIRQDCPWCAHLPHHNSKPNRARRWALSW
jgi:hypothetical protein